MRGGGAQSRRAAGRRDRMVVFISSMLPMPVEMYKGSSRLSTAEALAIINRRLPLRPQTSALRARQAVAPRASARVSSDPATLRQLHATTGHDTSPSTSLHKPLPSFQSHLSSQLEPTEMDHSHMDHGHMDHDMPGMGGGHKCNMNVRLPSPTLPPTHIANAYIIHRCSSHGPRKTSASSSKAGTSPAQAASSCPSSPSCVSPRDTKPCAKCRGGMSCMRIN